MIFSIIYSLNYQAERQQFLLQLLPSTHPFNLLYFSKRNLASILTSYSHSCNINPIKRQNEKSRFNRNIVHKQFPSITIKVPAYVHFKNFSAIVYHVYGESQSLRHSLIHCQFLKCRIFRPSILNKCFCDFFSQIYSMCILL